MSGPAFLLAQADEPEPMLPGSTGVVWPNVVLLTLAAVAVAVVAWRAWVYIRNTRHTADEALQAVTEVQQERQRTGAI